jgi:hypothetical protein
MNRSPRLFRMMVAMLLLVVWRAPLGFGAESARNGAAARTDDPTDLQWDTRIQEYQAKAGETSASFVFHVTNVSGSDVLIITLHTSCGCTVARLPPLPERPFVLAAGAKVAIEVTLDFSAKQGVVEKVVVVESSAGFSSLRVRARVPLRGSMDGATDRATNAQMALVDRQAVLKGECVRCHVDNGIGKMGRELYVADCAICHESPQRAAMVPDLKVARSERDDLFWRTWILLGKERTMMPAFGLDHGGPLTLEQVD